MQIVNVELPGPGLKWLFNRQKNKPFYKVEKY